jgi:hypothetical protein
MKTLLRSGEIKFYFYFFPPSSPYVAQEKLKKQVIKKVWPNKKILKKILCHRGPLLLFWGPIQIFIYFNSATSICGPLADMGMPRF